MQMEQFLEKTNLDSVLKEYADQPHASAAGRMLAMLSVGTDPEKGCAAIEELTSAIDQLGFDAKTAKHRIAEMLARPGNDYQRAMFYALARTGLYINLWALKEIAEIMGDRRDTHKQLRMMGLDGRIAGSAFDHAVSLGPVGTFDADFKLCAEDMLILNPSRNDMPDFGAPGEDA